MVKPEPRLKFVVVKSAAATVLVPPTAKLLVTSLLVTVTPPLPSDVAAAAVLRLPLAPAPLLSTEIRPAALSKVLELDVFEVPNVAVTVEPLPSLKVRVLPADRAAMPVASMEAVDCVEAVTPAAAIALATVEVLVTCVVSAVIAAVPVMLL